MKLNFILLVIIFASFSTAAIAKIKYYPDPVYKKLGVGDNNAMDEVYALAKTGDIRAEFIIGDLFSKGKGGIAKDVVEAKKWFKKAALQGHHHSFIRLAALAKHKNKNIEAWKWYSLAIKNLNYGEKRTFVLKARKNLVEKANLSRSDIKKAEKLVYIWDKAKKRRKYNRKIASFKSKSNFKTIVYKVNNSTDKEPALKEKENIKNNNIKGETK